jgi:hypothetical protein
MKVPWKNVLTYANHMKGVVGSHMTLFLQFACCSRIVQCWMRVLSSVQAAALYAKPKQVNTFSISVSGIRS